MTRRRVLFRQMNHSKTFFSSKNPKSFSNNNQEKETLSYLKETVRNAWKGKCLTRLDLVFNQILDSVCLCEWNLVLTLLDDRRPSSDETVCYTFPFPFRLFILSCFCIFAFGCCFESDPFLQELSVKNDGEFCGFFASYSSNSSPVAVTSVALSSHVTFNSLYAFFNFEPFPPIKREVKDLYLHCIVCDVV